MSEGVPPGANVTYLELGQLLRCIVEDTNTNGQRLTATSPCTTDSLVLVRNAKRLYAPGEIADFWVIYLSADNSFGLLSDSNFGFMPISDRMRPRYIKSLRKALDVFREGFNVEQDDVAWLSDLKGMYTRSFRKDQWDWYVVWSLLGSPPFPACRIVSDVLGEVARAERSGAGSMLEQCRTALPRSILSEWQQALEALESDAPRLPNQSRRPRRAPKEPTGKATSLVYDSTKLDTANRLHSQTLLALVQHLVSDGYVPHEHDLADLFCQHKSGPALFEVKSLSDENEESQIRAAFSQLSYYGYLASKSHERFRGASRWLVLSRRPIRMDLLDWLEAEGIGVIWLEDLRFRGSRLQWQVYRQAKQ